jgi:hypothetical protein
VSSELRVGAPAWWCEQCRAWWPGGWGPLYLGDPDVAADLEALCQLHAHDATRTCAECGSALVLRVRTVAIVSLRTCEDDDGT